MTNIHTAEQVAAISDLRTQFIGDLSFSRHAIWSPSINLLMPLFAKIAAFQPYIIWLECRS